MWRSENKRQESVFSFHHVVPRVPLLTEPAHQPLFFFFIQKLLEILFPLRSIPGDTGDISSKWARLAFTQQVAGWLWYHKHHASGKANQVNWIILLMAITSGPTGKHNSLWQKAITLINEIAINYDIGHMTSTPQHMFTKYKPATDGNQTMHNPEPGSFWKQHQKELPCSKTSGPEILGPYLSIPKDFLGLGRWLTWQSAWIFL